MRTWVDHWLGRISRQLFVPRCVLCAGVGDRADLCAACRAELPRNDRACARCALPLAEPAPRCGDCLRRPPPYAAAWVPYRYAWPLDGLVQRFKFGAELGAGRVLSALLAEALAAVASAGTVLVPVPLGRARLAERGFNQAHELARLVAAALDLRCEPCWLARTRDTPPQSGLDARARRRNLRGAFTAGAAVHGRELVLLDDVVTTGATVRECARALRVAGAARVTLWAVARAPR